MKERVISAFIAFLLIIPLMLLGGIYFKTLVIVLGILGLKEMLNLKRNIPTFLKIVSYLFFVILVLFGFNYSGDTIILNFSIFFNIILVLFSSLLVFDKSYNVEDALYLVGTIIFLSSSFYLFIAIRNISLNLLIYIALITIVTDTFAYIGGRRFGKTKLAPKISPNKTKEGALCGLIVGTIIPSLFYILFINNGNILIILLITMLLSIIGQIGDLVFSNIKRHYMIKDFSNIMPGHGGILDRLDSIIFVVITYSIISSLLFF